MNPRQWLVDEEVAQVVRRIFDLCIAGLGPTQIARGPTKDGILTPTAYLQKQGQKTPNPVLADPCRKSYKSKKKLENPPEDRLVFENTHPAIIEQVQWDRVQELRKNKR